MLDARSPYHAPAMTAPQIARAPTLIRGIYSPISPGERVDAWVSHETLADLRARVPVTLWKLQNYVTAVAVLCEPDAIFKGLRWHEEDEKQSWWCFSAITRAERNEDGTERAAVEGKVWMACMNPLLRLFEWRREDADPKNPTHPKNWEERFGGKVWHRSKKLNLL